MQQLYYIKKRTLEWRDVSEPVLQEQTDVLVRPLAVSRCDLDVGMLFADPPFPGPGPFPFGHEFVAEVLEIGDGVQNFKVGDRVIVPFQISCGSCSRCRKHFTGHCANEAAHGFYGLGQASQKWGGAFSDVVRVPFADHMLVPLPKGIAPEVLASASDNMVDGWRSVGESLQHNNRQSVLVVGGGAFSIGLYSVAIAKGLGADGVVYLDTDRERLEIAEKLGAKILEGYPDKPLQNFDLTVDAASHPKGLKCAIQSTEPGGTCTSIGIYPNDVPFPFLDLYLKSINFRTGLVNSRTDIEKVLNLVEEKKFNPEVITTKVAPWDQAIDALMEKTTKVVVVR